MTKKRVHIVDAEWLEEQITAFKPIPDSTNGEATWLVLTTIKNLFPAVEVPDDEEIKQFSKEYSESFEPREQLTVHSSHYNGIMWIMGKLFKR